MTSRGRKAEGRLSLRAFAEACDVSHSWISRAVAEGRIAQSVGQDAKGRPFIADPALARRELRAASAGKTASLADEQRRWTAARADAAELALRVRRGELIELFAARRQGFEAARVIREALLNVPARIAAELAAEPDEGRVYVRLTEELRAALTSLAEWLAPADGAESQEVEK